MNEKRQHAHTNAQGQPRDSKRDGRAKGRDATRNRKAQRTRKYTIQGRA